MMYLDGFAAELNTIPCVVGIGRTETHPIPTLDDVADAMAKRGTLFPLVAVDVRQREDVLLLLDMLLTQIEADLA